MSEPGTTKSQKPQGFGRYNTIRNISIFSSNEGYKNNLVGAEKKIIVSDWQP